MHEMSPEGYPTGSASAGASSSSAFLEPYDRSNTSSRLSPPLSFGRRRRLPATPTSASHSPGRRCSSPRFLPTPPPSQIPSSATALPSDFFTQTIGLERRPSTGRRLPKPPVTMSASISIAQATAATRRYTTDYGGNANDSGNSSSAGTTGAAGTAAGESEWPSPTVAQRKFSELRKASLVASAGGATSPPPVLYAVTSGGISAVRSLQRPQQATRFSQPRGSLDHSSGTPSSTNAHSQSSSLSPSIEQLTNSSDAEDPLAHGINLSLYQQGAAVSSSSIPDIAHGSAVPTSSSWPENEPRPTGLGLIHCSLQHFPIRKRFRVSLLKAEGLAGKLKPELEIHAFCKISLVPHGKSQSSIIRRGRDVAFNQEFFFDNVSVEDLDEKCLAITVCHQSPQKLQKDIVIGDLFVPLKNLIELRSKKEVKIIEELKHRINSKKLGKIYTSSCLETEARRLTINIIKVEDLPKGGITGPPDVCVRVRLTQGDSTQTKQSRVIKNTCNAVYKEAIMFLVKTKAADLQDTGIIVSVHDLSRTTAGDDVIGSVYLGKLAADRSEQEQWKSTVDHPGKEFKGVHHLKAPVRAPDVHVTEAPSDSE